MTVIGFNLHIFNEAVLNGTIVMILVTCTISSVITERAAAKMKVGLLQDELDEPSRVQRYAKNTLIPVSNPLTVASLVDLAILMQNPYTRGNRLYALHVRNDNSASARAMGQGALEIASNTAASVDVSLTPIERYDMNFVTGVINTVEERDINEVILGMHRKSNVIDSFFGSKIEQLLGRTHKMVLISRCFIPVSTITRIVVYVPDKAQYESGFSAWIMGLGNLTRQLGCRIIFMCNPEVQNYIRGVIHQERYDIRHEYRHMEDWDDFVLLANRILDDDLFVVVSARKSSLSFDAAMEELPTFLQKYFSRNNLVVIYPEQSGTELQSASFVAPLSGELSASPSEIWLRLSAYYRKLIKFRKRFTQRNRTRKIDL